MSHFIEKKISFCSDFNLKQNQIRTENSDSCDQFRFIIHERLKKLIIILISVVRSHFLDFDIKLNFNFKIKLCEDINDFILDEYNFDSHIADKIIHEDDKIIALIL